MSNEPSWKSCEDCKNAKKPWPTKQLQTIAKQQHFSCGSQYRELYGTVNLSTLCDKCIVKTPCSICKKIIPFEDDSDCECDELDEYEDEDYKKVHLEISHWNEEPICTTCKELQCYRCGEEGYEKTWYGWTICEDCGMDLCNNCGGECDEPCLKCERPCDYDCSCSEEEDDD